MPHLVCRNKIRIEMGMVFKIKWDGMRMNGYQSRF